MKLFYRSIVFILVITVVTIMSPGYGVLKAFADEPIKVGVPLPLTGYYAGDGLHMKQAALLAVEDINAQGGVLGRPVELVFFDIEDMMAEKLIAAADKLVMKDKVDAVITGYAGMGPDVPAFGKYDVPFLCNDSAEICLKMVMDNYDKYSNVFQMGVWGQSVGREPFKAIQSLPYNWPNKKIALIMAEFENDIDYVTAYGEEAKRNGWEIVMKEVFPVGTNEWGSVLAKLRKVDPALIVFESQDPANGITFFRQFLKNPTNSIIDMICTVWWTGFVETLDKDADGLFGWWGQEPLPTPSDPDGVLLKKRYEKRFGMKPAGSWMFNYDNFFIWKAAVERVGSVSDYPSICKAMIEYPYRGIGGRWEFHPELGNGVYAIPTADQPVFYVQIQNGEPVRYAASFSDTTRVIPGKKNSKDGIFKVTPYHEMYPWVKKAEFQIPRWIKK